MTRWPMLAVVAAACSSPRSEAASNPAAAPGGSRAPSIAIAPIAVDQLCLTRGALGAGATVSDPTMRGYARDTGGDAAELAFSYRGDTAEARELADGQLRRQIGLKLRAQDSCNVVYVMWRLDPAPKLDVSVKLNPGKSTHAECGADGYIKVRPGQRARVPAFEVGATHRLRAEIVGDLLYAWIDGGLAWQGRLPESARAIAGPAGVRSDNVTFELVALSAQRGDATTAACKREGGD